MLSKTRRSFSRPRLLIFATSASIVTALVGSPLAQALIMKDGIICDPIRHMGC